MEFANNLREELSKARAESDQLFRYISPDSLYERPIAERNRLIFYRGHLEAFDWNVLGRRLSGAPVFHASFDALFERGIDPEPGQAPSDTPGDWPSLAEVDAYNSRTRAWVDEHLDDLDPQAVQMAIEHRYMHAETFAYLMHNLPYSSKTSGPVVATDARRQPDNPMIQIAGGVVTLGKNRENFGWDNEHLANDIQLPDFQISKYKISNGEYLQYLEEAGGTPSNFWFREGDRWMYRGMFGSVPLPLDHPVWVTWTQAAAYAKWRGCRLPSEAQFQRALQFSTADPERDNFSFKRFDPVAVDVLKNGESGLRQLIGNGWEWTRDIFAPYQGFEISPLYPGYSSDFFDNEHYVMKGASPRTAQMLTRPSFRNWFRPEYPHMYAGFRLVEE